MLQKKKNNSTIKHIKNVTQRREKMRVDRQLWEKETNLNRVFYKKIEGDSTEINDQRAKGASSMKQTAKNYFQLDKFMVELSMLCILGLSM